MWLFHLLSRVHGLGCLGALAGAALLVPKLQALSRLLAHEGLLVMEPPPSAALLLGVVDLGPLAASWRLNPTVLSLLQLDDLDERVGAALLGGGGLLAAASLLLAAATFTIYSLAWFPLRLLGLVRSAASGFLGTGAGGSVIAGRVGPTGLGAAYGAAADQNRDGRATRSETAAYQAGDELQHLLSRGAGLARSLGIASNSQEAGALGLSAAVCCYLVSPLLLGLCVAGTLGIALTIRFASSTPAAAEEPPSGEEEPAGRGGGGRRGRSRSPRR